MGSARALQCSPASSIIADTACRLTTSQSHPCNGSCRAYPTQVWSRVLQLPPLSCKACTSGAMPWRRWASGNQPGGNPIGSVDKSRNNLESLFSSDSSLPSEVGKPLISSSEGLATGCKPHCAVCESKGAVQCETCAGSGLYVDSILESQGIIVKVRCLGCGGCGDILCPTCGGRGHV